MEVTPGYKLTEVGVIPDDWIATTIGELVDEGVIEKPIDGNHGSIHPKSSDFVPFGIPFVMANNVQGGQLDLANCSFIKKIQADSLRKGFSKAGDVLLTHKATIGNTAIVEELQWPYIMLTPQVTYYRVQNKKILNNSYLRYYFESSGFQSALRVLAGGGTRAYIGISSQRQLPAVLPTRSDEQRAIAEALSDVDALLGTLGRLIAKKRDLKQAAMQQLLTGEIRLPGFAGRWEERRLGDLGKITGAGVDKKVRANEVPVRLLNYMDVYRNDVIRSGNIEQIVTARSDQATKCTIEVGDVFFTPTSEVRDDIAHAAVAVESIPGAVYSYHLVRLRLNVNWDIRFRSHVFKTKSFLDQASTLCEGSGTRYVITLPKFRSMVVRAPIDVAEQRSIAAILSDIDAEIDALEQRRAKTVVLKQGMMQELLTGRTRLV